MGAAVDACINVILNSIVIKPTSMATYGYGIDVDFSHMFAVVKSCAMESF